MLKAIGKQSTAKLNALLNKYSRQNNFPLLQKQYQQMQHPNHQSFVHIFNYLSRNNDSKFMAVVLKDLERFGVGMTQFLYNSLLLAHSRHGNFESMITLFDSYPKYRNELSVNLMLQQYCKTDFEAALKLFEECKDVVDAYGYNAILNLQSRQCSGDIELTIKEMESKSFLNTVGITSVLNHYSKLGDIKSVERTWSKFDKLNCKPSLVSYNARMNAYSKNCQLKQTKMIFEELKANAAPDVFSYGIMIDAYVKLSRESILDLWDHMVNNGIKPNMPLLCTKLEFYYKNEMISEMEQLFREIKRDFGVQVVAYKIMIKAYGQLHCLEKATTLWFDIKDKADTQLFNIYLHALVLNKSFEAAKELFSTIKQPNIVTFTILAQGSCLDGNIDGLNALKLLMKSARIEPNVQFHNTVLETLKLAGNEENFIQYYRSLRSMEKDDITTSIVLKFLADSKNSTIEFRKERLVQIVQSYLGQNDGIFKDLYVFNSALLAYCKLDPPKMWKLWDKHRVPLETPNSEAGFSTVIDCAKLTNNLEKLRSLEYSLETSTSSNILISFVEAYCALGLFEEAVKVFELYSQTFNELNRKKMFNSMRNGMKQCDDQFLQQKVQSLINFE